MPVTQKPYYACLVASGLPLAVPQLPGTGTSR
jgi:hypothetical protein